MRNDRVVAVVTTMRMETDNKVEIPLIRIGFTFFSHIIRSRLAEMKSANGNFC